MLKAFLFVFKLFVSDILSKPQSPRNFTGSGLVFWNDDINGTSDNKRFKKQKGFKIIYNIYLIEFLKSLFVRGSEHRIIIFGQTPDLSSCFWFVMSPRSLPDRKHSFPEKIYSGEVKGAVAPRISDNLTFLATYNFLCKKTKWNIDN